ncbi:prepilin peptidase [Paraburkholderia sediminicola]|uniref:A24 family peptidase n=1 Tax=Paraburkholderia sediminicola TaxID=458836 RepID=UPI0038B82737
MHVLSLAVRLATLCGLLWLAAVDVHVRRLPNPAVLMIGAMFFADAWIEQLPLHDVLVHIGIAVSAYAVCAVLFALRMMGGGDAKLASVIFLWSGSRLWLPALMLISIVGLLVALLSLATRSISTQHTSLPMRALALFSGERGVPYGVALALGGGTVIVLAGLLPLSLPR